MFSKKEDYVPQCKYVCPLCPQHPPWYYVHHVKQKIELKLDFAAAVDHLCSLVQQSAHTVENQIQQQPDSVVAAGSL